MNISFEYSALWLLLIVPLALGVALFLYFFREGRRKWSDALRYALTSMRFSLLLILGLLLLEPFIIKQLEAVEQPLLLLFEDRSASVTAIDRLAVSERFDAFEEELADRFDVRRIAFAEKVDQGTSDSLGGLNTDLGAVFEHINQSFQGSNIGAVVLASDGMLNKGSDPRYAAFNSEAPLYTFLLGDTALKPDLRVAQIRANKLAFLGNTFEVKATIEAMKCGGDRHEVILLKNGAPVDSKSVSITDDVFSTVLSFMVPATEIGVARYSIVLDTVSGEVNQTNNAADTYVEVLDNRTRVVCLAHAPHPDIAALKESIEKSDQYEVEVVLLDDWDSKTESGDLFVLHGLPAGNQDFARLEPIVNAGKPVLSVVTADVSLVHFNALNLGVRIRTTRNQRDKAGAWINPDFGLFNVPGNDELRRYPPLMVPFGEMNFTSNAHIALKQTVGSIQTDQPFLVFTEQDGQKHGILMAEGWWRWRLFNRMMDGQKDWTDDLVQKSVQYLAVRQKRTRLAVRVPDRFLEGEPVIFEAEYYNESFELSSNVPVALKLFSSDSTAYAYRFNPQGSDYRLNLGSLAPGEYRWSAKVEDQEEGFRQSGVFKVLKNRAEFQSTVAQHDVLRYIAAQHGGESFELNEQEALQQRLNKLETAKPVIHTSSEWISLIDWQVLLYLIAFLAGLEWLLRKINGYV